MTGEPAMARADSVMSASQRTWLFAVTVTGSLVMAGSIAVAQLAGGSRHGEGNR
jgi:hypothetical protein